MARFDYPPYNYPVKLYFFSKIHLATIFYLVSDCFKNQCKSVKSVVSPEINLGWLCSIFCLQLQLRYDIYKESKLLINN